MEKVSKAELKRQKLAAKLKKKLQETSEALREYSFALNAVLREQGKPTPGLDDYQMRLSKELGDYSTFF